MLSFKCISGYRIAFLLLTSAVFAASPESSDVVVYTTSGTLNTSFVRWVGRHAPTNEEPTIDLSVPSMDVYADGVSIYYGEDGDKNVAFLKGLPGSAEHLVTDGFRPTLKEMVAMLPELQARRASLLSGATYTVVGWTCLYKEDGRKQHQAMEELRKRSAKLRIRVVEILVRG